VEKTPPAVTPITIDAIEAARKRIAATIVRTPLIKLQTGTRGPEIYLKLENLQPINSFKLRGAANAVACLEEAQRSVGVWTISAGNAGQGVAYAARQAGVPCTVVTIETAPETKVERMRALGAHLVTASFDACWEAMERRTFPGVKGTFVHPFDDDDFIAGNATMGLEIIEDLPEVRTVIAAIGGGGLVRALLRVCEHSNRTCASWVPSPRLRRPGSILFEREGVAVPAMASDVRRRCRGKERFPADVGTDAAGG
jgi:threonine dehydratase